MANYRLTAQTVRFLICALRYVEGLMRHQLAILRWDTPFFQNAIASDDVFFSLPLYKEYSDLHHVAAWFDCAFIVMNGNNRDNLKFMMAYTEELKAERKRPIELKQEVYEITMSHNLGQLKAICNLYLHHLYGHKVLMAGSEKISPIQINEIDETLAQLSDIMEGDLFFGVEAEPLAALSKLL